MSHYWRIDTISGLCSFLESTHPPGGKLPKPSKTSEAGSKKIGQNSNLDAASTPSRVLMVR